VIRRPRGISPVACAAALVVVLPLRAARAQAVTEWRTPAGVPVAVVELAGGDVEHLAALVPPTWTPPAAVSGWPAATAARQGALLWSVTVPTTVAAQASVELAAAVAVAGCGAVVAAGPVPVRELRGPLAGLEAVAAPMAYRPECLLADGRDEVVRGSDERVDLFLAVPQPSDPRFDELSAVAAVLERRLAGALPGVRAGVERHEGCWRLAVRLAAGDDAPRSVLRRVREQLAAAVAAPVDAAEIAAVAAPLRRATAVLAGDAADLAERLAERLAQGGRAAGSLTPAVPGPAAASELLREIAGGRSGSAVIVEAERRSRPEAPETLENGVIVSTRWLADDVAVVALAFGALDPSAAGPLVAAVSTRLAAGGWTAQPRDVAGVPVVTAVVPPADTAEAIEALSEILTGAPPEPQGSLLHDAAVALGLHGAATAETLSLALALPPDAEEGVEAARKLLSQVPAGGVRSTLTAAGPQLAWTPGEGVPQMAAIVELPPTTAGWLAGEVIAGRATDVGAQAVWMSPAGRLAVVLVASGEEHVPALDARLAAGWTRMRHPTDEAELVAAAQRLFGRLYGDLPEATARAAALPFLPDLPSETDLLAPDVKEVGGVLAALPAWDTLQRIARGPAPAVVEPPVRKSPSRPGKG
jgi:hypothetical protein